MNNTCCALRCVAYDCANNNDGYCIFNIGYLRINDAGQCDAYEPPEEDNDGSST